MPGKCREETVMPIPADRRGRGHSRGRGRSGVAALDYVLVLAVILPLVAFVMWIGPRVMQLAYEMVCVLVSWPFM